MHEPGAWPVGGGEAGALVRETDWSRTPLGPLAQWPPALRTVVQTMLDHPFPQLVLWGPELVQVYNDGYGGLMGERHPAGMGRPTRECWPEAWPIHEPLYRRVWAGASLSRADAPYAIARVHGVEDARFTVSYSPLRDDAGAVAGVLVTAFETTARERETRRPAAVGEHPRDGESRDRSRFDTIDEGLCVMELVRDDEGSVSDLVFREVNGAFPRQTGLVDVVGRTVRERVPAFGRHWIDLSERVARTGVSERSETAVGDPDRRYRVHLSRLGGPGSALVAAVFEDVTAPKGREAALRESEERMRAQKEAFQAVANGAPLEDALDLVARMVVRETKGEARTAFYVSDPEGRHLHPVWGAGDMSRGYLEAIDGFVIGEDSLACGLAVPRGRPVLTPDVRDEPRWRTWLHLAETYDFRACWSFPVETRDDRTVGTFVMCFRTPRAPTARELALAEVATQTAAVVIASHTEARERARAEAALRESEARYRALFESMDEAYAVVEVMADETGRWNDFLFLEVNSAFMEHTGMPYPTGRTATEILGTPNPRWARIYGRVAETGEAVRVEEGEAMLGRVFDLNIFPLGGPGSRRVAVLFTNVTARKRAERALRELNDTLERRVDERTAALRASEERYRALFESIDEGFCITQMLFDDEGRPVDYRYLEVNPAFGRQTGLVDAVGRTIREMVPGHEQLWFDIFGRIAMDGVPARFEQHAGELGRWFDVFAFRVGDPELRLVAMLFNDVGPRKRAEGARSEAVRRLVTAEEDERRRISRELHDSLGQLVTGLLLGLKALPRDGDGDSRIADLERLADRIAREMQHMAVELRPPALDNLGIRLALEAHLEEWSQRYGIECDYHSVGLDGERFPAAVETTLYRAVQEGLNNVVKHARASRVSLVLEWRKGVVGTILEDDGRGFDVEATLASPEKARRLGLRGMRERVALLGGELEIESSEGGGTTLYVRIPVEADDNARDEA